jgi:chaperone required for assembly of F1-ATPase
VVSKPVQDLSKTPICYVRHGLIFVIRFSVQLTVSSGLLEPFQDAATMNKMKNELTLLSQHTLLGVYSLASSLSSLVIAMSLVHDYISVQKAVETANLETEYQIKKWGTVEWSHTVSFADTTARVAAATLFIKHYRPES